jgi:Protein of unknown function (DUF2934)
MESIVVTRKVAGAPVPVIAIESAVESTPRSNGEDRNTEIALRAYYKAEARGYEPGHEIQDWLEAEAEMMSERENVK